MQYLIMDKESKRNGIRRRRQYMSKLGLYRGLKCITPVKQAMAMPITGGSQTHLQATITFG